jgi:hypothetical protein
MLLRYRIEPPRDNGTAWHHDSFRIAAKMQGAETEVFFAGISFALSEVR